MDVRWTDKWYIPLLIVYHRKEPDPIESPFNINQIETLMLSREPSISQCIVASPPTKKKSTNFRWNYYKRSFEFARQKYNSGKLVIRNMCSGEKGSTCRRSRWDQETAVGDSSSDHQLQRWLRLWRRGQGERTETPPWSPTRSISRGV